MAAKILFGNGEWYSTATTFLFLIVTAVAFGVGELFYGILAALVFAAALLFHITKPRGPVYWGGRRQNIWQVFWLYVDTIISTLFGVYSALLLLQRSGLIEIIVVISVFLVSFYIYWRASKWYEVEHTLWHIIVVGLSISILL